MLKFFRFIGVGVLAFSLMVPGFSSDILAQAEESAASKAVPVPHPKPSTPPSPTQASDKAKKKDPKASEAPPKKGPSDSSSSPPKEEENATVRNHVLQGNWNVYWFGDSKVTRMNIVQASGAGGLTNLVGAFATQDGEACPLTGTVFDLVNAQYEEGPTVKTIGISAYVLARAQCQKGQLWIEAFGLPTGKVLMSGRITFIPNEGQRSYVPVALGR